MITATMYSPGLNPFASASFALALAATSAAFMTAVDGFSPLMRRVLTFLLGAVLGMTRQSHREKMMPREMVAAVNHLGTPTLAWRQETQSDQLLQR